MSTVLHAHLDTLVHEHAAELLSQLGSISVPMVQDGMPNSDRQHLILGAGDRDGAVFLAWEAPTVSDFPISLCHDRALHLSNEFGTLERVWWARALVARSRPSLLEATALVLGLAFAAPHSARAQQPRRSQRAAVMQMIGTTRVEITYSRPVARGRTLFGSLVPWGRVWNPGADTATAISVSAPVLVNGARLPAGSYSLWAIPGEREWTFIFSRAHPVWHVPYRDGQEALRVRAVPERGPHMETLAFYFPVVDGPTAVLRFHWGEVVVPLRIEAEPSAAPGST